MNTGKTLFAQVMEHVPWKTFGRIIERHNGDAGVRKLSCADVFRIMAFAQLPWRESLRDIEVCLTSNQAMLLQRFTLELPEGAAPCEPELHVTLRPKQSVQLRLSRIVAP